MTGLMTGRCPRVLVPEISQHRILVPASALGGATVLVVSDLAARTMVAPAEIPLGVLTSLVGSPFFFWQLRRTRRSQGGWA